MAKRGVKKASKKPKVVRRRNKAHLIEPYEHLLGKRRDEEIAEMAGVGKSTVSNYRHRAGIAAPPRKNSAASSTAAAPAKKASKASEVKGSKPAKKASRAKGSKPAKKGRKQRSSKIDPHHALVGQVADRIVAEKAGVTVGAVQQYRRKLGIPSARASKREAESAAPRAAAPPKADAGKVAGTGKTKRKARRSKIDPYYALLGQVSDRVVAEKAGVTVGAVQAYRKRFGIPSTRALKAAPAVALGSATAVGQARSAQTGSAPAATASAPASNGAVAWKVSLAAGDVAVVAAASLSAAAFRAEGLGEVVSLERVGPLV